MHKMKALAMRRAVVACLCTTAAGFAHTAVIEQYDASLEVATLVSSGNGAAVTSPDRSEHTLTFALFDGSLGELTDVTLTYQGHFQTAYTVARDNRGPNNGQATSVTIGRSAGFEVAGGVLGSVLDTYSTTHVLSKNASATGAPSPFGTLVVGGTWHAAAADLAAFVGAGSFDVTAFAALTQTLFGPNGTSLLSTSRWWGSAQLSYAFTPFGGETDPITEVRRPAPVPEPSALLLAGIGLLAMVAHHRRRHPG